MYSDNNNIKKENQDNKQAKDLESRTNDDMVRKDIVQILNNLNASYIRFIRQRELYKD